MQKVHSPNRQSVEHAAFVGWDHILYVYEGVLSTCLLQEL